MTPNLDNERLTVQNPLLKYAIEIGWRYVSQSEALSLRKGESGLLFYKTLKRKLIDLNPDIVTIENVDSVINKIENVRNNIEGNYEVLKWLRGQKSIYLETEKRERNVTIIDFSNPLNNVFNVTDEWSYTNGKNRNRADIVFLINGIPVAIVETKSAKKDIEEALIQIERYHRETPELLTYPQIFSLTHLIDFYYGVTWNLDSKNIFKWKDKEQENFEKKVKIFFGLEHFLKFINDWIIFFIKDDELKKIVLRQHQTRAIEKIVIRAFDHTKKTGLIWHTQGSGKTFTMIKTAEILLKQPIKPTVLMLVDRNELEGQLSTWVTNVLGKDAHKPIGSKKELKAVLKSGYRGLIISMIHKFNKADENLSDRKDIFVLIDEAHRSTGRDLGNYLTAALPNATFIGFTGTPIDKTAYGKGTFKVFGKDDKEGYLDKYSIVESIEDNTTLPLHYALAPNNIRVSTKQLEDEFFKLAETEGISDIEELNKILEKAVNLKNFLKGDDRVDKVAKFVSKHFRENIEPLGYKAFLVAVDRQACALYKQALDKYLPPEYSVPVYTKAHNDEEIVKKYYLNEDEEKKIRKDFLKSESLPKILIVTEKLLTGFDAPILYCMYLDKPMRDHTLLQAIARVNRPYEDEKGIKKPFGFVLDFVGIFDNLEKALAFDSDVVNSVIKNIDVIKQRFAELMSKQGSEYLNICKNKIDDKTIEQAIEFFSEKSKRKIFFEFYKELEMLYEVISPDPFLRKYMDDYSKISSLYYIIKNKFQPKKNISYDFKCKTEDLVRESVKTYLEDVTEEVGINEEIINTIKSSENFSRGKVINLIIQILKTIDEQKQPFLISLKERAELILEHYENRQIDTETVIKQIQEIYEKYKQAQQEKQNKSFDETTFTIYWILKNENISKSEEIAVIITQILNKFPHYLDNPEQERQLKIKLYNILKDFFKKEKMLEIVKNILSIKKS